MYANNRDDSFSDVCRNNNNMGGCKKILSKYLLNFFYNNKVSNLCDTNVQFKFQMKRKKQQIHFDASMTLKDFIKCVDFPFLTRKTSWLIHERPCHFFKVCLSFNSVKFKGYLVFMEAEFYTLSVLPKN